VRNPLGVIRASAAMLREHFPDGTDSARACQFICDECDRLNGLISALLGFARPTQPRLATVEIGTVLERALALAAPALRAQAARVDRAVSGAEDAVQLDPDLIAQAVFDLLTNAAEAIATGGRVVRGVVAAAGAGAPTAQREQLFEPFVTTKARGTGLGLAMALRIAQAHGGALDLVDGAGLGSHGGGACFRLTLPRRPPRIEAAA
jgi:two-component system sensor histidine kinase HydH